jgi:2Fe-2S ferredoxin
MSADRVRLRYDDREIPGRSGERLLDVILDAGIEHRHICGGRGFCTSCRVEVVAGSENLSPVSALERERLGPQAGELRLACQTRLLGEAYVRVPPARHGRFSLDELS